MVRPVEVLAADTPLTDINAWVRGSGLEIVLLVVGAVLLGRFIRWIGDRITRHIDSAAQSGSAAAFGCGQHRWYESDPDHPVRWILEAPASG